MSYLRSFILAISVIQLTIDTHASERVGESLLKMKRDISGLIPFPRVGRFRMAASPFFPPLNYDDADASETGPNHSIMRVNRATSGLIPFPRVGRSSTAAYMFDNSKRAYVETKDQFLRAVMDRIDKEGRIPYGRIGRSGSGPKRNGAGTSGSLWFGPRLGKRAYPDITGADSNPTDDDEEYFNQYKVPFDEAAASVKAGEFQ